MDAKADSDCMTKHTAAAANELAELISCAKDHDIEMLFSHMSRLPIGTKSAVYRHLAKRGLIVKHPENDRYPLATVWKLTDKALDVRPGEELSAIL